MRYAYAITGALLLGGTAIAVTILVIRIIIGDISKLTIIEKSTPSIHLYCCIFPVVSF